jgi:hypothetical protein
MGTYKQVTTEINVEHKLMHLSCVAQNVTYPLIGGPKCRNPLTKSQEFVRR